MASRFSGERYSRPTSHESRPKELPTGPGWTATETMPSPDHRWEMPRVKTMFISLPVPYAGNSIARRRS